ncbi:MAG: histidine kinase [Lachnospiraceae bacterium]|nr:histidine kinase [Lachnospiraceae bacterium]
MAKEAQDIILKIWPCVVQLFGLTFAVSLDSYLDVKKRRRLLTIVVLVFIILVLDFAQPDDAPDIVRIIVSILGYTLRPSVLAIFILIVDDFKAPWIYWIPIAVNTAIYSTALFTDLAFTIKDGAFRRGPLGFSAFVVGFSYLAYLTFLTVREHIRMKGSLEGIIPIACSVFIVLAVVADLYWNGTYNLSFLTVTMVTSCVFYYIWLHLQFVRKHERALMAEQRIRIMISQIQPHFLYNTLSTIQALCLTNPEKAADITQQFGVYLRQNIDSLDQEDLIPFDKEMEHTRIYAEIEQVRFPSIRINYEILDSSFRLPALTLQPMVENAIRHGVRIRKEGIIDIRTYYEDRCHVIEIEDNGKGFVPDFDTPVREDENGRSHIGLRNVKERIETLCGGTFEVNSVLDVGTKITMRIPEKEED